MATVLDGDTLVLANQRPVRLLGIDAPEMNYKNPPPQPLAKSARRRLNALAPRGTKVGLGFDIVREDKYRRLLAHLYLADGRNVQAELLRQGLATTLVEPPNQLHWECYHGLEADARKRRAGIWNLSGYQPVAVQDLPADVQDLRLITGTVQLYRGRDNLRLNLSRDFALRIFQRDLQFFTSFDPAALKGRRLEVRGRIYGGKRKGKRKQFINLRHEAAMQLLD